MSTIFEIKIGAAIPPPVVIELLKEDLESIDHDEATADDHEDHVEEEVSVIVVTNTIIEPGTVMVHLENTSFTHAETEEIKEIYS